MNAFRQAVAAHNDWKVLFQRAIRDGGGDLQVETIRLDNRCLLGLWLHGDASNAVLNPEAVAMLRDAHAEFHAAAANVLSLALSGRTREAIRAMEPGSQYDQWSVTLTDALTRYAGTAEVGS